MADMKNLLARLEAVKPLISEICKISGTPGSVVGVAKDGELIFSASSGVLDVDTGSPPNDLTIFHVASLTKAMSAVCIGLLVHDGKLKWDTPLSTLLPDFKFKDDSLKSANIKDLLAHRLGMARYNGLWSQGGNGNHLPKDKLLETLATVPAVDSFRDSFRYWNFGYSLVGEVIERLSGESYGTFLTNRVLKPLNMTRTFITVDNTEPENYAAAHIPLTQGGFTRIPRPFSRDGSIQGAAGGVRSCLRDMVTFYNAVLEARKLELSGEDGAEAAILKEVAMITSAHNFVSKTSEFENSVSFGLLRVQLPNQLGAIGYNGGMVKMPTLGLPAEGRLVLYHQGSYPGFLSSSFLVPQDGLVIVVLTNSLAFNDAADWIGQMLLETALDLSNKHDFTKLAQKVRDHRIETFSNTDKEFAKSQKASDPGRPANAYVGDYFHKVGTFFVRVFERDGHLCSCFQGYDGDVYKLQTLDHDTFSFYEPWDDQARRGRWPSEGLEGFKFTFLPDANGEINSLKWSVEGDVAEPDVFTKAPKAVPDGDSGGKL